jgi:hypothetical protein
MFSPFQINILNSSLRSGQVCPRLSKDRRLGSDKLKSMIKILLGDGDIICCANKENIIFPDRFNKT